MKRSLLLTGCCGAMLALSTLAATATDFNLKPRDPGPGHRLLTYWWNFNHATWELVPPQKFTLSGGTEIRLQKTDNPALVALCRETTSPERDLLGKKDTAAEDKYCRTLLPSGTTDLKLVSQRENPLPVNGLSNFEAVYRYNLGGVIFRAIYMVSRGAGNSASPGARGGSVPATPAPSAAPNTTGEYFTGVIVAPEVQADEIYQAFEQVMATARIKPADAAPNGDQYASHGMLNR